MMKKLSLFLAVLCLALSFVSCADQENAKKEYQAFVYSDNEFSLHLKAKEKFQVVAEDEKAILMVNGKTAEIALKNKKNGYVWYSNPTNRKQSSSDSNIDKMLNAQIMADYVDSQANKKTDNSYVSAIENNQYYFEQIDNGIMVHYQFGKREDKYIVPILLDKETLANVVSQLDSVEDKLMLRDFYIYTDINDYTDPVTKEYMLNEFPALKNQPMYMLIGSSQTFTELNDATKEMLTAIFSKTDYTVEKLKQDNKKYQIKQKENNELVLDISVEYRLDNGDLVVNVPKNKINFDINKFKVTCIEILPYFGATTKTENAYNFVPDGSGAIIYANSKKENYSEYRKRLYSMDNAVENLDFVDNTEPLYLPVFGVCKSKDAFLAIIEKGDVAAAIESQMGGVITDYNTVSAAFYILPYASNPAKELNAYEITNYQKDILNTDYQIRYKLLEGDNVSYVEMAKLYGEYLKNTQSLTKLSSSSRMQIDISTIGGITKDTTIMGVPTQKLIPFTTYNQAITILDNLKKEADTTINLIYKGAINNGLFNDPINSFNLINQLGGKDEFEKLVAYAGDNNIQLFPNAEFVYCYSKPGFFSSARNTLSLNLTQNLAQRFSYELATDMLWKENVFLVSPDQFKQYYTGFHKDYSKYGLENLAVLSLGKELNSNFDKQYIDRQYSKEYTGNFVESLSNDYNLMVEGANSYILGKTKYITNIPTKSGEYYMFDESVPFYQIAISGYICYSCEPLNLSDDYRKSILRMLECGANPNFELVASDNYTFKDVDYDIYNVNYKDWIEKIKQLEQELLPAYKKISGQSIIDHKILMPDVRMTAFENGTVLYCNYSAQDVTVDGITVKSGNYAIGEIK